MIGDAMSGGWEIASMGATKRFLARLWSDDSGISSVEYALLLAFVAAGIIFGAEELSNAVEDEMTETAALIDGCNNGGAGDGTGGDGGSGQGGSNTC